MDDYKIIYRVLYDAGANRARVRKMELSRQNADTWIVAGGDEMRRLWPPEGTGLQPLVDRDTRGKAEELAARVESAGTELRRAREWLSELGLA
jgi:hypothetical protein